MNSAASSPISSSFSSSPSSSSSTSSATTTSSSKPKFSYEKYEKTLHDKLRVAGSDIASGTPGGSSLIEELENQVERSQRFTTNFIKIQASIFVASLLTLFFCVKQDVSHPFFQYNLETMEEKSLLRGASIVAITVFAYSVVTYMHNFYFSRHSIKRNLYLVAAVVAMVAFFTHALNYLVLYSTWFNSMPFVRRLFPLTLDFSNRPLLPLIYMEWIIGSTTLVYLIASTTNFARWNVFVMTILNDYIMIVTGFIASYAEMYTIAWTVSFILTFVTFIPVIVGLALMLQDIRVPFLTYTTVAQWALFPIVWTIAKFEWMSPTWELIFTIFMDLFAKNFFCFLLLNTNFETIDQMALERELSVAKQNQQLEVINKEIEDKANLERTFFALISHDLKAPLNSIINFVGLVMQQAALAEEHKEYIQASLTSAEALLGMINNILDFARLKSTEIKLQLGYFKVLEMLDNIVDITSSRAISQQVNLVMFVPIKKLNGAVVKSDKVRLRQVLVNIVDNAIKFSKRGSEVVMKVEIHPTAQEKIYSAIFSITDFGIGMGEQTLKRLYQPFNQVNPQKGGSGLGLVISKKIIEAMEGRIEVSSEVDRGTTFKVIVPLKVHLSTSKQLPKSPTVISDYTHFDNILSGKTVLVIATSKSQKKAFKEVLSAWKPAKVIGYASLNQCLSKMEKHPVTVHVMVIDYNCFDIAIKDEAVLEKMLGLCPLVLSYRWPIMQASHIEILNKYPVKFKFISKPVKSLALYNGLRELVTVVESPVEGSTTTAPQPPTPPPAAEPSLHVLVVDDNALNQKVLSTFLNKMNVRCDCAFNGQDCLNVLDETHDIIFLDLIMPVMGGYEVAKIIREKEERAELKKRKFIVCVSGSLQAEEEKKPEFALFDQFMGKPIAFEQLRSIVDTFKYTKQMHPPSK